MTNPTSGDVYCDREPKTGRYLAYQIINVGKGDMTYLLLDYFDAKQPDQNDVMAMKPLNRYRWFLDDGAMDYCHSGEGKLPSQAVYVGHREPMISGECNTYGSWPTGYDNIGEIEWLEIPEDARRRFKGALSDLRDVTVAGVKLKRSFRYIGDELLSAMQDYTKELEPLQAVYSYTASKFYPQLIPFLETRWTAGRLEWTGHGQTKLDFSRTHLRSIILQCDGVTRIILPKSCDLIVLSGKLSPDLRIESPTEGSNLTLQIDLCYDQIPDPGLPRLSTLILSGAVALDLTPVPRYFPALEKLDLRGKPGSVSAVASLAALKSLKWLSLEELFGFTAEDFPTPSVWPRLNQLYLESIPEEAGKAIKSSYKGKVDELYITKLRKPEWLAENLTNPLRHWDGSEFVTPAQFKKSVAIYKDTRRKALTAAEQYQTDNDKGLLQKALEQIAKDYVLAFNKLDARTEFIETEEREDLCAAFDIILDAVDATTGEAFKADRDAIYEEMDTYREW